MTPDILARCTGIPLDRAEKWAPYLTEAMARYDIDKPARQASFLAQTAHESALFTRLVENLNYSAEGLLATWPKRFNGYGDAALYARKPQAIANLVYGGRMGNGPANTDDGWNYRGRGLIMVTGKANYSDMGTLLGLPLVENPELLEEPEHAAMSAAAWWDDRDLNEYADAGLFEKQTRIINGGVTGLPHRLALYSVAMDALA